MRKLVSITMKRLIVPIVCMTLAIALGSVAWADPDESSNEENGPAGMALSKETVTIAKKSSTMVVTSDGQRYAVNSTTMVVGENGSQVMLKYLLIPCEAQLVYKLSNDGSKLVHGINVLSTHSNATNSMSEKPN